MLRPSLASVTAWDVLLGNDDSCADSKATNSTNSTNSIFVLEAADLENVECQIQEAGYGWISLDST